MAYDFKSAREDMVKRQLIPRKIIDQRVLEAMSKVPREAFVPDHMKAEAYDDRPLPIGRDQTISQPYIVALMTQALELKGTEKVLEIGTGSGYQAAVLAELCDTVYTVERIEALLMNAREILQNMGYTNIRFKVFDGTLGWPEHSPYDAVIVTAAAPRIPRPLLEQMKEGGSAVVPVGDRLSQSLTKVTRDQQGYFEKNLGGVRFVRLVGDYGWKE
ncbi:MAG: protein-L-isoaspartate(D-aspartate) O-methyltransferase [Deltaproteobacteria bacterium]|nr:protein-L-isoaspartate(D-aspartate) O-methyltransferase [Deltaproteobacteria bacterium]